MKRRAISRSPLPWMPAAMPPEFTRSSIHWRPAPATRSCRSIPRRITPTPTTRSLPCLRTWAWASIRGISPAPRAARSDRRCGAICLRIATRTTPLNAARAFHGAELPFLFGNLQTGLGGNSYSPSDAEIALSNEIMGYWVRLAATGDPNGAGAVPWLPYDVASENILQFDDNIVTLAGGYRNAQCDFLSTLPTRGF